MFFNCTTGQTSEQGFKDALVVWVESYPSGGGLIFFDDNNGGLHSVLLKSTSAYEGFCHLLETAEDTDEYLDIDETDSFYIALESVDEGKRNLCFRDSTLYCIFNLSTKILNPLAQFLRSQSFPDVPQYTSKKSELSSDIDVLLKQYGVKYFVVNSSPLSINEKIRELGLGDKKTRELISDNYKFWVECSWGCGSIETDEFDFACNNFGHTLAEAVQLCIDYFKKEVKENNPDAVEIAVKNGTYRSIIQEDKCAVCGGVGEHLRYKCDPEMR